MYSKSIVGFKPAVNVMFQMRGGVERSFPRMTKGRRNFLVVCGALLLLLTVVGSDRVEETLVDSSQSDKPGEIPQGANPSDTAASDVLPPNTKYTVVTHSTPRPKHHVTYVVMAGHDGKSYECVMPSLVPLPTIDDEDEAEEDKPAGSGEENVVVEEDKASPEEMKESLDLLLEPLIGRCFLKNEGYWSFEVCHKKKIRQFHQTNVRKAPVDVEYSLGDFSDKASTATPMEGALVAHTFTGGTRCDETSGPRNAVVHYVCSDGTDNTVRSIQEQATCSYDIVFATPLLCSHPSAKPFSAGAAAVVGGAGGSRGAGAGRKAPSGVADFLVGLEGSCFYRVEGWWTYELCYGKTVKQFHQENGANTAEFVLGVFAAGNSRAGGDPNAGVLIDEGGKEPVPYYSQSYIKGTKCDVTGDPRQVEARFKCGQDSHNVIVSIKERATCSYVLDFFTPLVCPHPSFQTTQDPLRSIDCYPEHDPERQRQDPVVA